MTKRVPGGDPGGGPENAADARSAAQAGYHPMNTGELAQFLPLAVWYVITGIPGFRIIRRTGLSAWWALFLIIQAFGAVIVLWIVAYRRWPGDRRAPQKPRPFGFSAYSKRLYIMGLMRHR